MRRGLAVLLFVVACAPHEVDAPRVVLPPAPPLAVPPAASRSVSGPVRNVPSPFKTGQYWTGNYVCNQGESTVTLSIVRVDGNHFDAEFEFEAPGGVDGTFKASGTYDASHGEVRVRGGEWISRPASYEVVDMHGTVSDEGDAIDGQIDHIGCGDFHVDLQTDEEYD
ncbi:hypothetical protein BH09MYX1_BH09MYX1_28540 [soil metagenome]